MAKATALCTCKTCGAKFEKVADKRNRRECDEWEAWAVNYFDECTSCYGRRMREAEEATPAYAEIKLDVMAQQVFITLGGNTRPIKDEVKSIGYKWAEAPADGFFGMLATKAPRKCWIKTISDLGGIDAAVKDLLNIGITDVRRGYTDVDLAAFADIAVRREKAEGEKKAKMAELVKPVRPEWVPAKWSWNGKYYGSAGLIIYLSGQKIVMTAEQKQEWLEYQAAHDAYRAEKKKIEEG